MSAFRVETNTHRDRTVLAVVGKVELEDAPSLIGIAMATLADTSTRLVVIDLARVTDLNPAALDALMQLRDAADAMDKGLLLSHRHRRVYKLRPRRPTTLPAMARPTDSL